MFLRTILRLLHLVVLGIAVVAMAVAAVAWFYAHSLAAVGVKEVANVCGLIAGVSFGLALLRETGRRYSQGLRARRTIVLLICWTVAFTWYWFNMFPIGVLRERGRLGSPHYANEDMASLVIFLLWLAFFSLGPFLRRSQGDSG